MRSLTALLALAVATPASAAVTTTPLARLFMVTHYAYADNFYSLRESQIAEAMGEGYENKQVVGFMESGPDGANALAFRRTYGGPPQIDHFYTTRINDFYSAVNLGYIDEGAEGALRVVQNIGALPLYRLSLFEPSSGDVMHWYGLSASQRNAYLGQGWIDEGIEGYMWPVPTNNVNMQGGGATVSLYKFPSTYVILKGQGYVEPGGSIYFGSCGGEAKLYIDGVLRLNVTNAGWHYGPLPGYASYYGCYAEVPNTPTGTHNYRVEFTGYVAKATGYSSTVFAPYTLDAPFTVN